MTPLVRGALAGLAGTAAGAVFLRAVARLAREDPAHDPRAGLRRTSLSPRPAAFALARPRFRPGEEAAETVGRIAARRVPAPPAMLAQAAHWGFGAAAGALYAARTDRPGWLGGALYGAAVWTLASEGLVPMLGLSPGPTAERAAEQAKYLAAHIVYGATAGAVLARARGRR